MREELEEYELEDPKLSVPFLIEMDPFFWFGSDFRIVGQNKVGCVFPMIVVSILPHAEFGPNNHREYASHFNMQLLKFLNLSW